MNKSLMLIAALTFALGTPVMAHEGEHHDEPKANNQDQEKKHKEHEHKRHDATDKDHKGDHKDAKGAKAIKKKGKRVKVEEPKTAPPADMPTK